MRTETADPSASRPYLGRENEEEWGRLLSALELADGFALHMVWVHDGVTAGLLTDRLRGAFGPSGFRVIDVAQAQSPFLAWLFDAARPRSPDEVLLLSG